MALLAGWNCDEQLVRDNTDNLFGTNRREQLDAADDGT